MGIAWNDLRKRVQDQDIGKVLLAILQAKHVADNNTLVPKLIKDCEYERSLILAAVKAFKDFADHPRADLVNQTSDLTNSIAEIQRDLLVLQGRIESQYERTIDALLTRTPRSNKRSNKAVVFGSNVGQTLRNSFGSALDDFVAAVVDTVYSPPTCSSDLDHERNTSAALKQARYRERKKARLR